MDALQSKLEKLDSDLVSSDRILDQLDSMSSVFETHVKTTTAQSTVNTPRSKKHVLRAHTNMRKSYGSYYMEKINDELQEIHRKLTDKNSGMVWYLKRSL